MASTWRITWTSWTLVLTALVTSLPKAADAQAGSRWLICRNQANGKRFPGYDCNQYIECNKGVEAVKTCGSKEGFNPNKSKCERNYKCAGPRGLWRQTMTSSGLVAIHCTLIPGTGMVAIWHRGLRNIVDIPPDMRQPDAYGHEYMSAVIDPFTNTRKGYEVAPSFCGGHVQLPDSSILNCGGEPAGFNGRGSPADKDDGIDGCRILKCNGNTVDKCAWSTVGKMSARRWYPGMLLFPHYDWERGAFAMVMGGTTMGWDSYNREDVMQTVDWIWPVAKKGRTWANSSSTNFTRRLAERNLYPALYLMPFRANNSMFVMFQWGIDYGELAIVDNPDTNPDPITTQQVLPSLPRAMGVTYPTGGCVVLQALEYPWDKGATVSIFGGHNARPDQNNTFQKFPDLSKIDASWEASRSAFSMNVFQQFIWGNQTWEEEAMPGPATMRTCLTLPNGKIMMFHGVKNGRMTSTPDGLGCGKNQVYNAWIYDPKAKKGKRFTVDPVNEPTFRAYHSCGLVMPDGSLFGAGGDTDAVPANTTNCVAPRKLFYNVDAYVPPNQYNAMLRNVGPRLRDNNPSVLYFGQNHTIYYSGTVDECSLVTPGANTHQIEQSSRVVFLRTMSNNFKAGEIVVNLPWDPAVIMLGQHMLFCMANRDVYTQARWITLTYK